LLLVDDGSNDGSTALAREYAEKYPETVRYLEHEGHQNRGMSAARNLGICHARGDYIFFLDSDDVMLPNTLETQVDILESHPPAALVFGPIQWWYSWTRKPEDIGRDFVENLGVPPNTLIQPPGLLALFLRDKATVPSGFLVRREAVERVGGFEDAFRGEYEDQVFCAKVCLTAPVFASDQCWYRYRQHEESCVSVGQRTGRTYSARLSFLNWLAAYLADQKVRAPEVRRALRCELWRYGYPNVFQLWQRAEQLVKQMRGSGARG
jgi:glycosyltransferase involved in cell wall biosynthesis